ncbi:hypothetical protein OAG24_01270 [bacterium]|nr:hypothetical protein [bacterium]
MENQILTILIILVIVIIYFTYNINHRSFSPPEYYTDDVSLASQSPSNFKVTNYLLKPVKVVIEGIDVISRLDCNETKWLTLGENDRLVQNGNIVSIYILDEGRETNSTDILYSNYVLDFSSRVLTSLKIGMITSRWVGADQDSVYVPAGNAVQGRPWVKVHNLTNIPISFAPLNGNFKVAPYSTSRYSGRDHFGVRIGTLFTPANTDVQSSLYPVFKFNTPATDIYYGVVSDIDQPAFGGWQIDSKFSDEINEPQWLLENGWEGGPGFGHIVPGYLPKEGPNEDYFQNLNEWGQRSANLKL